MKALVAKRLIEGPAGQRTITKAGRAYLAGAGVGPASDTAMKGTIK